MKRKKAKLKHIRINEVSLVDKGANPGAEVLLFKRNDEMEENKDLNTDVTVEDTNTEVSNESENEETTESVETKEHSEVDKNDTAPSEGEEEKPETKEEEKSETDVEKQMSEFSAAIVAAESLEDMWELHQALRDALKSVLSSGTEVEAGVNGILNDYMEALKAKIKDSMDIAVTKHDKLMSLAVEVDKDVIKYLKSLTEEIQEDVLNSENPSDELTKRYSEDQVITEEGVTIVKSIVGDSAFEMIKKVQQEKKELQEKYDEEMSKRKSEELISKASESLKDYPIDESVKQVICEQLSKMDEDAKSSFEKLFSAGKAALTGLTEQVSVDVSKIANKKVMTDQEKALELINKQKKKGK